MGLGKQSKTLTRSQVEMVSTYLRSKRNGLRNQTIFLLSVKSGLRSKEISQLKWSEVMNSDGEIDDVISLTNRTSKGRSGRKIPMNKDVHRNLREMLGQIGCIDPNCTVIRTERSVSTSSQSVVNMFQRW